MQREDIQRLKLALRRLASIENEDAERFLLFLPPLPVRGPSGLASLAAAAVVATIGKATPDPFATTFGRHHPNAASVSRDLQYRLALVFSQDSFERASSLASVLAELKLEANPDEVGGLMLGSVEVFQRYRGFFQNLTWQIDDSTPATGDEEPPPPLQESLGAPRPDDPPSLRSAVEAVMAARGSNETLTSDWRSNKAGRVLAWAAATAFGHLSLGEAQDHLKSEIRG